MVYQLRAVYCIFIFNISFIFAQTPTIYFDHLTTADGLSQNTVISICQDSIGFMWFGTYNGLNRYDGYTIKRFIHNSNDSTSISHNVIEDMIVDKDGILWIATDNGLCRYDQDTETFHTYYHDENDSTSLGYNSVRSLCEDSQGNLWIGTYGGGLDVMDQTTGQFSHYKHKLNGDSSLSNNNINYIYEDRSQNLWIATDAGLNLLNMNKRTFRIFRYNIQDLTSISHDNISVIYEDREGDLWVGTWNGGLNRLKDGYSNQLKNGSVQFDHFYYPYELSNNIIRDILEDQLGRLWIATRGGGLNYYNRKSNRFIPCLYDFKNPHSISNNTVNTLFKDISGIFWVGTYGGIDKYGPYLKKFDLYQGMPGNPGTYIFNNIQSLYVDSTKHHDIVWIGSQSEGLSRWNPITNEKVRYKPNPSNPSMLPNGFITCICKDHEGRLWMGTGAGLSRLEQDGKFINYFSDPNKPAKPGKLSRQDVYSLCEDYNHNLWIGTYEGGLNCLNLDNENNLNPQTSYFNWYNDSIKDSSCISDMSIRTIYQDSDSILWIGTENGGLNRYQKPEFKQLLSDTKDSIALSDMYIRCIYEDRLKALWIGTSEGLFKIECFEKSKLKPIFKHYTEKDGLINNVVNGILEDKNGFLWISTNNGLSKFNPDSSKFKNYSKKDGLQGEEFYEKCFGLDRAGNMYFGGNDGLNVFHPDSMKIDNPFKPPVVITDFQLFNRSVPVGEMKNGKKLLSKSIVITDTIYLKYNDDVVTFEFAALHYGSPTNNQYRYFLEGFDKDWIDARDSRKATYTNLDPGEYIFHVKASNNDKVWNNIGVSKYIFIKPAWWQTTWFQMVNLFLILLAITIVPFYIKIHRRKFKIQEELEKERKNRVEDLKAINKILENVAFHSVELMGENAIGNLYSEALSFISTTLKSNAALYILIDKGSSSKVKLGGQFPNEFKNILKTKWDVGTDELGPYKEKPEIYDEHIIIDVFSKYARQGYLIIHRNGKPNNSAIPFNDAEKICLNLLANAIGTAINKLRRK